MSQKQMIAIVQDNFQQAMRANIEYHDAFAKEEEKVGDNTRIAYHNAMASVYRSFLK